MTRPFMGVTVRHPAHEFMRRGEDDRYRQENAQRLVNSGVEMQRLKRDNPYLQETLRRLAEIQAETRQAMNDVRAHNERRLAALHGATRKKDRRLLDQMHQLLPRIEQRVRYRAEAPRYKEGRQLVLAAREAVAREEAIERYANDLPDPLAAVVRQGSGGVAPSPNLAPRGVGDRVRAFVSSTSAKAA